jgi:hypothetical protein
MPNRSTLLTPMHPISLSIVEPASGKGSLGRCTGSLLLCILLFFWAGHAYAEHVDSITFSDGEQLAGKLVSILGGTVTFHSEILGNVTVPLARSKPSIPSNPSRWWRKTSAFRGSPLWEKSL